MITTKIVVFHYSDKQRCIVFEIFELVNQQFLARDVYIIFFLIIFVFIVVNSYSHFFFLIWIPFIITGVIYFFYMFIILKGAVMGTERIYWQEYDDY